MTQLLLKAVEEVDSFIKVYNQYLHLKESDFSDVVLIKKKSPSCKSSSEIKYLLNCFDFPKQYLYAGFCFGSNAGDLPPHLINFASHIDYSLEYVYNIDTGWVSLWSYESWGIEWHCSASVSNFFKSMTIIMEVKFQLQKHINETGLFELDPLYLRSKFEECMKINDNNQEVSEFYAHLIGIDM